VRKTCSGSRHGKADNFIDEGLEKNATTMSQIPTYVTAVPNGTEKVCKSLLLKKYGLTVLGIVPCC